MKKLASTSVSNRKQITDLLQQIKVCAGQNKMLETAIPVAKLHNKFGLTPDEIQYRLSEINCKISKPHIYNHFKLADIPHKVKAHIRAERIQPTRVLDFIHKHQDTKELIQQVEEEIAIKEVETQQKLQENKMKSEKENIQKFHAQIRKVAKKLGIESNVIKDLANLNGSFTKKSKRDQRVQMSA